MEVGIVGAGAIGMGYAAYLIERGHTPNVWSPSGARTAFLTAGKSLKITGAIEGEFAPSVCDTPEAVVKSDFIMFALPAYGWRSVFDQLLPLLEARHTIIMSGHLSFAALYLSKRLAERNLQIPIAVWNTTALTAKTPTTFDQVRIGRIRTKIDLVVIPSSLSAQGRGVCESLFGDPFTQIDDLITNALGNLNPLAHLAIALCNLTRMERGEDWLQNTNSTNSVCNLMQTLDDERLAIASAFGKSLPSMKKKMEESLQASRLALTELTKLEIENGIDPPGPKTVDTRYVLEDVPFGLVPTLLLAELAGVDVPVHRSGVVLLNACYSRDFSVENNLLPELGELSRERLISLSVDGFSRRRYR